MPYLPVISHIGLRFSSSQSKSLVRLYVGMGKVNILPFESPSIMSWAKTALKRFISSWKSP